jgi:hypothetical protein
MSFCGIRGGALMAITLLLAALFGARAAPAQPVYETRDRAGPVFSDLPSAGAREVELPPQINLMDSVEEPAPAPEPVPAVAPYRAVQITQPENGGTVHSNTGQFSIVVAIEPDLRTDQGDRIAITLDGTLLPQRAAGAAVRHHRRRVADGGQGSGRTPARSGAGGPRRPRVADGQPDPLLRPPRDRRWTLIRSSGPGFCRPRSPGV